MPRTLVLIPARGGSKGVPRKNLRPVGGRPLLVWTVRQALALAGPEVDVVVSTDDDEIARVALEAGAEVPFRRPADLARDETPTEDAVIHALEQMAAIGRPADRVMLLQATSPVRRPGTLARALAQFDGSGADALVGVVPQAPFLWRATHPPRAAYDVGRRPRRQELTAEQLLYRETGSLYVTAAEVYRREHHRLGGVVELFVMDEIEGTDIDTEHDLVVAEAQLRRLEAADGSVSA